MPTVATSAAQSLFFLCYSKQKRQREEIREVCVKEFHKHLVYGPARSVSKQSNT
jgi:hypothetical protein